MKILFKLIVAVGLALTFVQHANASTTCQPTAYGPLCISQVSFSQFAQQAYQPQQQTEWCWAASISMMFAYYGYQVAQPAIVTEAYGTIANVPAPGVVMAQALNRTWKDGTGNVFTAKLSGLYDAQAGLDTLDNMQLINELDQNRPFVIGTGGHAVVVTAIEYYNTMYGPQIQAVGVFDPWPGVGARGLSAAEATPASQGGELFFAATVSVSPGDSSSNPPRTNPPATNNPYGGGGALDGRIVLLLLLAVVASWKRYRPC